MRGSRIWLCLSVSTYYVYYSSDALILFSSTVSSQKVDRYPIVVGLVANYVIKYYYISTRLQRLSGLALLLACVNHTVARLCT